MTVVRPFRASPPQRVFRAERKHEPSFRGRRKKQSVIPNGVEESVQTAFNPSALLLPAVWPERTVEPPRGEVQIDPSAALGVTVGLRSLRQAQCGQGRLRAVQASPPRRANSGLKASGAQSDARYLAYDGTLRLLSVPAASTRGSRLSGRRAHAVRAVT